MTSLHLVHQVLGKPAHDAPPSFRFADLPEAWRHLANQRCMFCGRGKRECQRLWQYNSRNWVCVFCRRDLRYGRMPRIVPGSKWKAVLS